MIRFNGVLNVISLTVLIVLLTGLSIVSAQTGYELNHRCMKDTDCRKNAYRCVNETCDCSEQYRRDSLNQTCIGAIGMKCQYDSHCIEGAFCQNQKECQCKDTAPIPSEDKWKCTNDSQSSKPTLLGVVILLSLFHVL